MLNVAAGGRLLQNIESSNHRADYKTEGYPSSWHDVRLEPGSQLHEVFGADEIQVNSRHHQGVLAGMIAPGLRVVGTSPDGVIEAFESNTHGWVVGVQWHPERSEPEHPHIAQQQKALFTAFVGAANREPEPVQTAVRL